MLQPKGDSQQSTERLPGVSAAERVVDNGLRSAGDFFQEVFADRIHWGVIVKPGIGADEPRACNMLALALGAQPS